MQRLGGCRWSVEKCSALASLVASAKQHGLDPFVYLRDVLTRIAATPVSQLDQFLPDRWQAAHLPAALLD